MLGMDRGEDISLLFNLSRGVFICRLRMRIIIRDTRMRMSLNMR